MSKEWTSVISEENCSNPYWNIYLYETFVNNKLAFKIGKADKGYNYRYSTSDKNGKNLLRLAHQDIVVGKDSDLEIKNLFELDKRFKSVQYSEKESSDETFFINDNFTINDAVNEFEKFFTKQNKKKYSQSPEEQETLNELLENLKIKKGKLPNGTIAYFCPRYHKTAMILNVIDKLSNQVNLLISYEHTVKNSYIDDCENYGLNIDVVNIDEVADKELQEKIDSGLKLLIISFMTGQSDTTIENRINKIAQNTNINIFIDEGDIGLATEISKDKISKITKRFDIKNILIASGTGVGKMEQVLKYFGCKNAKTIVRSYIHDVLIPRGNKATAINFIKFKNTFDFLKENLQDFVYENWNDETIANNSDSIKQIFRMFYDEKFFDELKVAATSQKSSERRQKIDNLKTFVNKYFNKDAATILFCGTKNETHNIIKNYLDSLNIHCEIIDGSTTTNGDAEDFVKGVLKAHPTALFIATNMANRSFSIPEIKNEIILMNDPAEASYTQKVYRVATASDVFKEGNIWDFTLGKTDDNFYGIIKPELDRGEDLGLDTEKVLEEIYNCDRINFFFEALYNKDIFKKINIDELRKNLMFNTTYFDIEVDKLAVAQENSSYKFFDDVEGSEESNNKGKGDRPDKVTHGNDGGGSGSVGPKKQKSKADIFRDYAKMILGTKTYFSDFIIRPDFEKIGYNIKDLEYVMQELINKFGKDLLKEKMTDSWKSTVKENIELNARTCDYKLDGKSIYGDGDVELALFIKNPNFIKDEEERLGHKIYAIEQYKFYEPTAEDKKYRIFLSEITEEQYKPYLEKGKIDKNNILIARLSYAVNILKMELNKKKFSKIIMNPPYNGSLHLKILSSVLNKADEIVNLSPIRWLQDPLAEYKKNSDWKKFKDIRDKLEDVEVINMIKAEQLFTIPFMMDLGIYKLNNGGFNCESLQDGKFIVNKVLNCKHLYDVVDRNKVDWWRCRVQELSPFPSNLPNGVAAQARLTLLCHPYFNWVYKDGYTKDGVHWSQNIHHKAGPKQFTENDPLPWSIRFDTEEEANNFQDYTKTTFFKYLYKTMKTDQHVPLKYLPFMPTYSHPWTDEMLYKYFELTPEEIKIIEEEIKT